MRTENCICTCPRCGDTKDYALKDANFSSDIVKLSENEKSFIKELYTEDICIPCLIQLKNKFQIRSHSDLLK